MRKQKLRHNEPKERIVGVRFGLDTYNKVKASALVADITVSEYIRRVTIEENIKQEMIAEVPQLKKLIGEFGKIGSNLNQIAHHYNGRRGRSVVMHERIMRAISQLYTMKYEVERMGGEFFCGYSRKRSRKMQ